MDAPEIDSSSDFVIQPFVLLDKDGEKLVTMVKGTFLLSAEGSFSLAPPTEQRPLRFVDEPWDDPVTSPPKYPCDACGVKAATDVVVVAKGYAPEGKPVDCFDVLARIGKLEKTLRIFGLRVWLDDGAGLTAPRPLLEQEIRYDLAWGGLDTSDMSQIVEEPRNPVGLGVVRDPSQLTHQPAPCIEDPTALISSRRSAPPPAGFGAIGPHWQPRRGYAGTVDEKWHREQAPLLPLDRDERANQCASPGLIADPPLRGGEPVALMGLLPGGDLHQLELPRAEVEVELHHRGREPQAFTPHLDTVIIDTLAEMAPLSPVVVELVWRVVTPAPRRMKDLLIRVKARAHSAPQQLPS